MPRSGWGCVPLVLLCACQYASPPLCRDSDCLQPEPDAGGGTCHKDPDCPLGAICDGTRCREGCRSNRDCVAPKTCDTHHVPYGMCVTPQLPVDAGVPDVATVDVFVPPPIDAGCVDQMLPLLTNGNFDLGPGHGWVEHPFQAEPLISPAPNGITARSGSYVAWLGGYTSSTESITQTLTIPADATGIIISGYTWIDSADTTSNDVITFDVSGIPTLLTLSSSNHSTDWKSFWSARTFTSNQGGAHTLTLAISNDGVNATSLFLDDLDVSVYVCR